MDTHEVLLAVRPLVEKRWPTRCVGNLISDAAGYSFGPAHKEFMRAVGLEDVSLRGLQVWNDHLDRTVDEVLSGLDAAVSERVGALA